MAIEDILKALEDQAQADVEAVINEAKQHAALIVKQAEAEAEAIHDNYVRQIERNAKARAAKVVNAARLEAKMMVSTAKGDGVDGVFAAAADRLASTRSQPAYDGLFAKLAAEAFDGLNGDLVVHVHPDDVDRAQVAASSAGVNISVEPDLSTAGGVIVEADGGRVVRRNTLEDRLDRARQFVQTDVAKALFA